MSEKVSELVRKRRMAARLMAGGATLEEIAITVIGVKEDGGSGTDSRKMKNALDKLRRWVKAPEFKEEYREAMEERAMPGLGNTMTTLLRQVGGNEPYVAQNAGRLLLERYGHLLKSDEDKKTITVTFTGMPELGEPGDRIYRKRKDKDDPAQDDDENDGAAEEDEYDDEEVDD